MAYDENRVVAQERAEYRDVVTEAPSNKKNRSQAGAVFVKCISHSMAEVALRCEGCIGLILVSVGVSLKQLVLNVCGNLLV